MREIRKSGSEGGAGQTNVPFLPLSNVNRSQGARAGIITPIHAPREGCKPGVGVIPGKQF